MRIAGWKCSGHDPGSVLGCAPLWEGPGWLQKASGGWKSEATVHSRIWWLPSMAITERPHFALLWEEHGCLYCVQCKIWWKYAFFSLLLLGLSQHHLSWPTTLSLSFASAVMWISSLITCDSSECSVQPLCWLADFSSQHSSFHLSFETGPALFSSAAPLTLEHIPYCAGFIFLLVTYLSGHFRWAWSLNLVRVFLLIFYTVSCVR